MEANFALLGFLHKEANYGYELKKLYDRFFGKDKPILTGQVYSTLARLQRDKKIIEVQDNEESGGPERVKYEITKAGRQTLNEWLNTPETPSPTLQATLYIKTVLALLQDGDAAQYLDNQRRAHIARMRELTLQRRAGTVADVLLIDHAIFHLEADLRWIDLTSSRLTKLKESVCP